jgi:hypothetical protein
MYIQTEVREGRSAIPLISSATAILLIAIKDFKTNIKTGMICPLLYLTRPIFLNDTREKAAPFGTGMGWSEKHG